jgi:quinolinate synthase
MSLLLPMASSQAMSAALEPDELAAMKVQVRALARERGAVILAHNYQRPEIQDVADYVGDSLGLSRQAAAAAQDTIVFCGVHFMAETASVLCPEKTVLIPDLDAGCSLAASIDAEQLSSWRERYPDGVVVMYVNTTAEVKALTDYCCTSANAVQVVRHVLETHGANTEILFGPDMWLGAYVEKELGIAMHVWDGECHVHAGIRPRDIDATRAAHPGAEFLIHPECGCTTSVMEYVAAGDVAAAGVHMLSTGGMLAYARAAAERAETASESTDAAAEVVVATEVGMLYPLQTAAPSVRFVPANAEASCQYMKMITLPKLRDSLRELRYEVHVPADIARRARVPIDRMVAIG